MKFRGKDFLLPESCSAASYWSDAVPSLFSVT